MKFLKKHLKFVAITLIIVYVVVFSGYSAWNAANPEHTCAGCHEINPSFHTWRSSAHKDIQCIECHGTALSNGFHSLKEKGNMVWTHLTGNKRNADIRLTEDQLLETMNACIQCHQTEYTQWLSGGHSATYSHIFLNEAHNTMEQPYWDCLRCHGMFYEGTIYDLMEPISTQGPWRLLDEQQAEKPVMPCFACHQIHTPNPGMFTDVTHADSPKTSADRKRWNLKRNPAAALYVRADQMYLRTDLLPMPDMYHNGRKLLVSDDPVQRLCIQCHAPNYRRFPGSEDDRTPRGVHEGLSCRSCHNVHSNDASQSCMSCHPAISNCGLDVTTMNTTFFDPLSRNNIHFVSCEDCH